MSMWFVSVQADLLGMYSAGQAIFIHSTLLFTSFFTIAVAFLLQTESGRYNCLPGICLHYQA